MTPDIGIASLADRQPSTVDGRKVSAQERIEQIVELGVQADRGGQLRSQERLTWRGRFRPPLEDCAVIP